MEFNDLKKQYQVLKYKIKKNIDNVLSHGKYILGPEIKLLEKKLSKKIKSKYCVCVSSGTDALLLSLMALGISKDDQVITTNYSWISTIEVIKLVNATPVLVDINKNDYNIDCSKIEKKINKKTKAIIVVSLFGKVADFTLLNKISKKYNIPIIEDGAQSFGAKFKNKFSCNLSLIGCTSFFPSKSLGGYGDSGAIFTNNKKIYDKIFQLRNHGQKIKNYHNYIGTSSRMDTIQAAILLAKIDVFDKEINSRIKIAYRYNKFFSSIGIKYLYSEKSSKIIYSQYPLLVNNRKFLINIFKKEKIPFAIYYPKIFSNQTVYNIKSNDTFPNANFASKHNFCVPISPYMTKKNQDTIMNIFFENKKKIII